MVYLNLRENGIPHIEWVQWNSTVGSESYPLPSFLKDYFKANCPGGCFEWDTDMISSLELTRPRLMNTLNWELSYNSCYWPKFTKFVLSEGWIDKELQDIPGIGKKYGKNLRLHLKDYCSVPQLFDMFRYWWMNGVPYKFFHLLYWASNAINNNGNMHITRAYEAFRQKALLCLPCSIPNDVNVEDPAPMLVEE
ncbi:uncharacterized protein LOC143051069 [Mytilus galloprovincialis]|uniref:uncharacterized protein LOC143051069 n=1 Tax=Mytilus galloprovincialis TaxID=29158 RepID=UPI003F7B5654